MQKIAAAYIRVSDDRQDEYSPDSQLRLVREYAERHDYILPNDYVYYDDGISASGTRRRNNFNRMISDAERSDHPFDAIIVWKFSRFARNTEDSILYKARLRRCGVVVLSVSEHIDTDSEYGGLIERIIEWDDAHYLTRLSQEVKRGMYEKASRGEAMSGQFGYDIVDKILVPNADAETVRYIFQSFTSGIGLTTIARNLNASGVRTKRGNPCDNRFIEYILRNPVYIGKIRWSTEGHAASKRDYDNPNIVLFEGKHEPLISMRTWDKAQELIAERKRKYRRYQRPEQSVDYMLKGLLRCSCCGSTLVISQSDSGGFWQCHKYARGQCKTSHCIVNHKAEETILKALTDACIKKEFPIAPSEQPKTQLEIDYDRLIRIENARLAKAKDAYLDGIDTLEEYKSAKQAIQQKIASLTAERDHAADPEPINVDSFSEKVTDVIRFIQSDATPKAKNEALRTILCKIVFNKPTQSFDLFFYQ